MTSERASIFGTEEPADFDVGGFAPKKPETKKQSIAIETVRAVSEAANFPSREAVVAPVIKEQPPVALIRETRRHRTGRNIQLNIKVKPETLDTFYQLADSQGWVLGETLERALTALKKQLAT